MDVGDRIDRDRKLYVQYQHTILYPICPITHVHTLKLGLDGLAWGGGTVGRTLSPVTQDLHSGEDRRRCH